MENIKIGDFVEITRGGYGTFGENVGCIAEVVDITLSNSVVVKTDLFRKKDSDTDMICREAYKLAKSVDENLIQYEVY